MLIAADASMRALSISAGSPSSPPGPRRRGVHAQHLLEVRARSDGVSSTNAIMRPLCRGSMWSSLASLNARSSSETSSSPGFRAASVVRNISSSCACPGAKVFFRREVAKERARATLAAAAAMSSTSSPRQPWLNSLSAWAQVPLRLFLLPLAQPRVPGPCGPLAAPPTRQQPAKCWHLASTVINCQLTLQFTTKGASDHEHQE